MKDGRTRLRLKDTKLRTSRKAMYSILRKWFEPRSIISLSSVIVRVSVVLKGTVGVSG